MVKKKKEIVKDVVVTQGSSPAEMIRMAISGGADLDKLEKLLALQERFEANEARKIFAKDFAVAQANILPVVKKKYNQQTKSKYSDLSDVIETTQPIYTKEGFSVTFDEGDSPLPEHARILADVIHHAGHTRSYHYDVPFDGKGIQGNANMTKIHGKASSTSYGRRYLMCMIWNIPTSDNDGNTEQADVMFFSSRFLFPELRGRKGSSVPFSTPNPLKNSPQKTIRKPLRPSKPQRGTCQNEYRRQAYVNHRLCSKIR